jgi:hypothetical protein
MAAAYLDLRGDLVIRYRKGLTHLYNRHHDPEDSDSGVIKLREVQKQLDEAVAAAYGWTDLDLGHGFYETKQGVRYTITEPARREVLQRLLKLNHERYAEEVSQGLHSKKGLAKKAAPNKTSASKPAKEGVNLFDMQEDDE